MRSTIQKLKHAFLPLTATLLFVALIGTYSPALASAVPARDPATSSSSSSASSSSSDPDTICNRNKCDLVKKYVNPTINLLAVVFGLIAVISLILGGINYITSEGDPQKVSSAKKRIVNTIFAIFAFFFMYAFLQFIIPGGIF